MEHRLQDTNPLHAPSRLSPSFIRVLQRDDPGSILRKTGHIPSSLKKPILVLSGKDDPLIPWSASETFITLLKSPTLTVNVYDGVGHTVTPQMQQDFKQWFIQFI
jgi:predicted esterase